MLFLRGGVGRGDSVGFYLLCIFVPVPVFMMLHVLPTEMLVIHTGTSRRQTERETQRTRALFTCSPLPRLLRTQDGSAAFSLEGSDSNPTPSPSTGTGAIPDVLRGESFGWKFTSAGENAASSPGNPLETAKTSGNAIKGVRDSPTVGGLSSSLFDSAPDSAAFLANGERGSGGGDAAAADSLSALARGAFVVVYLRGLVCVGVLFVGARMCCAWVHVDVLCFSCLCCCFVFLLLYVDMSLGFRCAEYEHGDLLFSLC